MLKESSLTQMHPARTQRLSEGVFWFVIAATILLALLDARVHLQTPLPLAAAWVGAFALYYAVRSSLTRRWLASRQQSRDGWLGWLRRRDALLLPLLLDLLVITLLLALSGGWDSPLYLLYPGWAAALLDVASAMVCLWLSGLACGAFVLGCLLAAQQPFSTLQTILLAEHALLLLIVALGISGTNVYIRYTKSAWEAERRTWDGLRQVVFAQLSHELYTPLSAISASTALAVEDFPVAERQQHLLRVIERNCARMNVLIDDLLALWREPQRQFHYAPTRLACLSVAEAVGQMLSPLLEGKQQCLVLADESQPACVLADKDRLEQVLVNLLVNAHKYAPPAALITLTISGQGHDVLFAVHDDGAGVSLEEQGHLFELFYRGANSLASSRGAGLGLALAKALVVLQGGHIWVESVPGSGSTFYFTLPAAE